MTEAIPDNGPENPASNILVAGITEDQLLKAVARSGYPLQLSVVEMLGKSFYVQQEWSYIDRDTGGLRALDISASYYVKRKKGARIYPRLQILIECKQSDSPFIFFLSKGSPPTATNPVICGLKGDKITVFTDDTSSTWSYGINGALGLIKDPFLCHKTYCFTLSKAVRNNKKVELSGSDTYNSIVLPLMKAIHHLKNASAPRPTFMYFHMSIAVAVAVLDAPMAAVENEAIRMVPWVRLYRHEHAEGNPVSPGSVWAIDFVHKDFFTAYLADHLRPFARRYADVALKHHIELAEGEGFVSGMQAKRDQIEPRLKPISRLRLL